MKLPYKNRAYIQPEKIKDYLLSRIHEKGKHKARVFQRIGFNYSNMGLFERALLKIAQIGDVSEIENAERNGKYFGKKYVIKGTLKGPIGYLKIKSVWKILENKRKPSLVTVTPI